MTWCVYIGVYIYTYIQIRDIDTSINMGIARSGSKGQYKGDTRNHAL